MQFTQQVSDHIPPAQEGWQAVAPDSSGRWKDITKYSRQMTCWEVVTKWAAVGAITTLSLGIFALYQTCTTTGRADFHNLLNRQIVCYVKHPFTPTQIEPPPVLPPAKDLAAAAESAQPPGPQLQQQAPPEPSVSTPPYLESLPRDVRKHIEDFLPFPEWRKLRYVARGTKATVDEALLENPRRGNEFVEALLQQCRVGKKPSSQLLEAASVVKDGPFFAWLLCQLGNGLQNIDSKGEVFSEFLTVFKQNGHLSLDLLQRLSLPLRHQLLDTILKYYAYCNEYEALYFELATPQTLVDLAEKADRLTSCLYYTGNIGHDRANEICSNLCTEDKIKKLQAAYNQVDGSRKRWLLLVLRLIVLGHQPLNHEKARFVKAFRFIEKVLPDLTYQELIDCLTVISDEGRYGRNCPMAKMPSHFVAWKVIQWCRSCVSDDQLRMQFNQFYSEASALAARTEEQDRWKKCLIGYLDDMLKQAKIELLQESEELWSQSKQKLTWRLIYVLNGSGKVAPDFARDYVAGLNFWRGDLLDELIPFALEEWTRSCHDTSLYPPFTAIFYSIRSERSLECLITTAHSIPEPHRSLYLRAIAHAHYQVELPVKESFEKCGVPMPLDPVTEEELFIRLSKCSGFFEQVKNIHSQADLEAVLDEVLLLPLEPQKRARLSFLSHACKAGEIKGLPQQGDPLHQLVNYPLPAEAVQEVFREKGLDITQIESSSFSTLREAEIAAFMG